MTRQLRAWRRLRQFAVPRWMIGRATERRLAGDWRGACDAAGVDVALDPARIRREHGAEVAAAVEDDLRHLAPDLLRWHLLRPVPDPPVVRAGVPLAVHGRQALQVRPRHPGTPSRRLELVFAGLDDAGPLGALHGLEHARERWDSRHAGALLERCGGYDGHLPGFTATGERLPEPAWTAAERVLAAQDTGDWAAAWSLAGFDVEPLRALVEQRSWIRSSLRDARVDLTRVRAAVAARGDRIRVRLGSTTGTWLTVDPDLRVSHGGGDRPSPDLPVVLVERPVDFDLVRHRLLPLEDLHPLVGDALFPGLAGLFDGPPDAVPDMSPVRVRCQGVWHVLGDGHHTAEELRRELALHALGGAPLRGCFAAHAGWRGPQGWTPKALRLRRRDVVEHAVNGDGPALAAWLDAGLDPHLRDRSGRTLLHLLAWLPQPEPVVARLRHAGLDPQARDGGGRSPLWHAVTAGGTPQAVQALLSLGADPADLP
ncbi:hypothetical protein Daura_41800 [Dactylosporangium aurantiacum]|uniref:Ankyrin repeat domain-containing protein n=1 Tax=Dactylosporangium aurantiacum TaxID=35754 RepID=A0A9Q9MFW0_9ACTN|nr:ankyrin repeat domain-containing protein [Dactylosporangium aurantiacum]MDG6102687.1 hypothetical protein [Dactylosporangium aurantiacum]UWZ53065.1 hypothetical protein Daura_41800 [Dactylosporangium aurantiacum]